MKLHSPRFSRALAARLRAEARASAPLRKAIARHRGRRRVPAEARALFWRCALLLIPFLLLLNVHARQPPREALSAVASIWFLAVVTLGAGQVRGQALDLPPALLLCPFAPADFARLSRRRVLGLLWRPCVDALALFSALAWLEPGGPARWLAVLPLSALCGAAVWSGAVWLARFPPQRPAAALAQLTPLLLLVVAAAGGSQAWLGEQLIRWAAPLTCLSPGGWVSAAFLSGSGALAPAWAWGLAPALLLAASGWRAVRELVAQRCPEQALLALWSGRTAAGDDDDEACACAAAPEDVGAASALEGETFWRTQPGGGVASGWVERLFVGWLSERERLVMSVIATGVPEWTAQTRRGACCLAAGVAVAWLREWAPHSLATALAWAEGIALGAGLLFGLPLASGFDQLSGGAGAYGQHTARVALHPVRLTELVLLTLKAAVLRGALMAPLLAAAAAALAVPWTFPAGALGLMGAKLALLSAAFSPCLCMFEFSGMSNDTQVKFSGGGCLAVLLVMGGALALLALAAATLFAPGAWSAAALACFAGLAWGVARLYVALYERGAFDLVRAAQE